MTDVADTAPDRPALKPFGAFLQEIREGDLHTDLSEALAEVVQACMDTGKAGTLSVKFQVAPDKDGVTVIISDDVKVNAPKHASRPARFWPDEFGNLQRSDPRQLDISSLREVPGGKTARPRDLRAEGGAS